MQRLVTFGCSYTYGEGLKDCWVLVRNTMGPGPDASKYAWPALVANKLNFNLLNQGLGGASNKYIWHKMLQTKLTENDTVVFLWTYHNRMCFFDHSDEHSRIIIQDIDNKNQSIDRQKLAKLYFKHIYKEYDSVIDMWNRINFSKLYLDKHGIKNYHLILDKNLEWPVPDWNCTDVVPINFNKDSYPLAMDNKHPGEEAQSIVANKIFSTIK